MSEPKMGVEKRDVETVVPGSGAGIDLAQSVPPTQRTLEEKIAPTVPATALNSKEGGLTVQPTVAGDRGYESMSTRLPTAIEIAQEAERERNRENPIAGYTLTKQIGKGGEGEVWEATRDATGQRFAVKIFNHGMYQGGSAAFTHQRALAEHLSLHMSGEGSALAVLSEAGTAHDGRPFIVMNLIDSECIWRTTQREIFKSVDGKATSELAVPLEKYVAHFEETIRSAWFLSRILNRTHDLGLVHRDIKPDNLAFGEVSHALRAIPDLDADLDQPVGEERDFRTSKILDTGLMARTMEELPASRRVTKDFREFYKNIPSVAAEEQYFSGTHAYAAPEQYHGQTGPWSDQYSFGLSVYEMLTGVNPRKNDGPEKSTPIPYLFEALPEEFREKLKDPSFTLLGMPAANVVYIAAEVIRQSTETEYSNRFAKMSEFSNLLSECVTHDSVVHQTLPESVRMMIKQALAA